MSDSEWEGEPHILTVTSVTLPVSRWDDGELEYEITHLPSCGEEEHACSGVTWLEPACELGWWEREGGLAGVLRYSGTPVTEPGTYRIQSWGRKSYVWDCAAYEYDGGIAVVEAEKANPAEATPSATGESTR